MGNTNFYIVRYVEDALLITDSDLRRLFHVFHNTVKQLNMEINTTKMYDSSKGANKMLSETGGTNKRTTQVIYII